jgi:hypothetical protein
MKSITLKPKDYYRQARLYRLRSLQQAALIGRFAPIYVDADGDGKLTGADIYKLNPDPKDQHRLW